MVSYIMENFLSEGSAVVEKVQCLYTLMQNTDEFTSECSFVYALGLLYLVRFISFNKSIYLIWSICRYRIPIRYRYFPSTRCTLQVCSSYYQSTVYA